MVQRHERLLRQIFCLLAAADQMIQHPIDLRIVAQKQALEGRLIALAQALDQRILFDQRGFPGS